MAAAPGRAIEPRARRLGPHPGARCLEAQQDADLRLLPVDGASKLTEVSGNQVTGLHREDDLLGVPRRPAVVEVQAAVDPLVAALLGAVRHPSAHEAERPCLELERVCFGQFSGARKVSGLTDDLIRADNGGAVRIYETMLDEADGEIRDVDADPAAAKLLRRGHRGAATAEGVEDDITNVGSGAEDPLKERDRLLGRITQILLGAVVDDRKVRPQVLYWRSRHLIEISLVLGDSTGPRLDNPPLAVKLRHPLLAVSPVARDSQELEARIALSRSAGPREVADTIQPSVRIAAFVVLGHVLGFIRSVLLVPSVVLRLGIKEDAVRDAAEVPRTLAGVTMGGTTLPNDLISEVGRPEDRIEEQLQVMACGRVTVKVDTRRGFHHAA